MRVIYKYPLRIGGVTEIPLPKGSRVLTVQTQERPGTEGFAAPVLWVDRPDRDYEGVEVRGFQVFGTGIPFDDVYLHHYVGTFQLHGGDFVGHVYEVFVT